MKPLFSTLLCCGALAVSAPVGHAFSGEDPLFGSPWYHEEISEKGAKSAGFSPAAADSLGWNADYLDSYLYSPIWWAKGAKAGPGGALHRFRISLMTGPELEKLHFDDLFSAPRVHQTWQRYSMGAFAGLMWASETNDVAAAHNVLGASLHAMQDFYSHSNWIDDPKRRPLTYMEMTLAERNRVPLYTGAYELPLQTGIKSHGKFLPAAAIYRQPGVKQVMEAACSAISPLSNGEMCAQYKLAMQGKSVTPTAVLGLEAKYIPKSIVVLAPPGIALDNKWVAPVGVKQRGLTDIDAPKAFQTAYDLAEQQSAQWLTLMGKAMDKAGKGDFWNLVKNRGTSDAQREAQYEEYGRLPYMFLAAGPYHRGNPDGVYLRLKIKTADKALAGTDADIQVTSSDRGFGTQVLDWGRGVNVALSYNDFEKGDHDSYVVGPFASLPSSISIKNNAPDGKTKLKALGSDFVRGITAIGSKSKDLALSAIGGHADVVAENKIVWMPEDLEKIGTAPVAWTRWCNGGSEGNYQIFGNIRRLSRANGSSTYRVDIEKFKCHQEAKWDRGSNSDEAFTMFVLNPLPGPIHPYRTPVFGDVDSGESRDINHSLPAVTLPDSYGILSLAMMQMESDDEGAARRDQALAKFAGAFEAPARNVKSEFLRAIGEDLASGWSVDNIEIHAFDRRAGNNGQLQFGQVYSNGANFDLDGGQSRVLNLTAAGFRSTGVTRSMLLSESGELPPRINPALLLNQGAVLQQGTILQKGAVIKQQPKILLPR